MTPNIKLIAIDLDDTLLHDDISLSAYTKDTLRKAMQQGVRIVIATGRVFQAAHHPYEPIRSPSTVIPSAAEGSLLHCHHMHTCPSLKRHLGAFFFAFPSLTIYRSARRIPLLRPS